MTDFEFGLVELILVPHNSSKKSDLQMIFSRTAKTYDKTLGLYEVRKIEGGLKIVSWEDLASFKPLYLYPSVSNTDNFMYCSLNCKPILF